MGRTIELVPLDTPAPAAALTMGGVHPRVTAWFVNAIEADIAEGALADATGELSGLIGRPTTPLVEGLR